MSFTFTQMVFTPCLRHPVQNQEAPHLMRFLLKNNLWLVFFQAASQIKNAADQVALSCVGSSGIMGYEICVNRNMVPVANSVGNLETTYRTVEETIRSTSRSAITESYSCLSNAVSSIFKSTSQVESTANNCVKA